MRIETVTESLPAILTLSPDEARGLAAVGARLASQKDWWGAADADREDAPDCIESSASAGSAGASGRSGSATRLASIVVGDLELVVVPKIPPDHLLYLFANSGDFPRIDEAPAELQSAASLWQLVARAFVASVRRLVRLGLVRDYREIAADARGGERPCRVARDGAPLLRRSAGARLRLRRLQLRYAAQSGSSRCAPGGRRERRPP